MRHALGLAVFLAAAAALQPKNDLLLRAALGKPVDRCPVWLFRQAGRHMEEYRDYKAKTGKHFLQLLEDPHDVAEVTMQPLRRYDVDAAILFSDILVVPQALGVEVDMPGGVGIVVPSPVTTAEEAIYKAELARSDPAALVRRELKHVLASVEEIRTRQIDENRDVTLIGFSAAPWTLLYYTVGASSRNPKPATDFLRDHPDAANLLLDAYTLLVEEYLVAQVERGAHALQVFEAMSMALDEAAFDEWAMPRLAQLGERLRGRLPDVPRLVFARGAVAADKVNRALSGAYDVVTIDTVADRTKTRANLPHTTLQGNFDPKLLLADESDVDTIQREVRAMFEGFGGPDRLIANLGEGLMGKEDQELVAAFVDAVHEASMVPARA